MQVNEDYLPASATESGFVMSCAVCMSCSASVNNQLLTIGEMDCIQFETFVSEALHRYYVNPERRGHHDYEWKLAELLSVRRVEDGIIVWEKDAKW